MVRELTYCGLQALMKREKSFLVYFFETDCPEHSKVLETLNKIATIKRNARIFTVNTTKSVAAIKDYGIYTVPTFISFNRKKEISRILEEYSATSLMNMMSEAEIRSKLG